METNGLVSGTIEVTNAVEHVIRLEKDSGRALDTGKSAIQVASIVDGALTTERVRRGWQLRPICEPVDSDTPKFWSTGKAPEIIKNYVELRARCETKKIRTTMGIEFDNLVASVDSKAQAPANRWRVVSVDDEPYVAKETQDVPVDPNEMIGYAPFAMPPQDEWLKGFSHLYGLDAPIGLVRSVLDLAEDTNFRKRVHTALIGPPGCGKTDLLETVKRLVGQDAVMSFDGTSTTMAGAQQMLAEREELPRVMVIEEIEKAPEASLPWLLSIMDMRGEIRKVTARGNIMKDARMIVICTVNDEDTFRKVNFGALYSRFTRRIHFKRPTRDLLWRILDREIKDIGGREEWIDPTLDYAEEIDTSDPREIIAIALCGQDSLLDGSYQTMLRETGEPRAKSFSSVGNTQETN